MSNKMGSRRHRSRLGGWAVAVAAIVVGTITAAMAAETVITQASLGEKVTVSRTPGGAVTGAISSCTPELLVVLPAPKPKPKNSKLPDPPPPDPVQIPWKDVRHVSNGLTARLALEIWIAQHRQQLCPACCGERTVWCPTCRGTQHDPAAAADCDTCHGELLVDCKSAGEVDGQVGCPNGCLRLGVGSWSTAPDGLRRRTWSFSGGSVWYSEHHIGDVIVIDPQTRQPSDVGPCPVCGRTTKVNDLACHGTGKVPCPECLARRKAPPCPNHCSAGRVVCPACGGTGLKGAAPAQEPDVTGRGG